jgi:hypothetical protein
VKLSTVLSNKIPAGHCRKIKHRSSHSHQAGKRDFGHHIWPRQNCLTVTALVLEWLARAEKQVFAYPGRDPPLHRKTRPIGA